MNPEVKAKWVNALRSGEYEQTKGYLRDESGYCCLGVLCDLAVKDGVDIEVSSRTDEFCRPVTLYDGVAIILPDAVVEWAGLDSCNPDLEEGNAASYYNDKRGFNFNEIAHLIEENL